MKIKKRVKKKHKKAYSLEKIGDMSFLWQKDEPKNLQKCQPLELHNLPKKAAQNLDNFNLIAKLYEKEMVVSDANYHLNCLTSLSMYLRDVFDTFAVRFTIIFSKYLFGCL